MGVMFVLIVRIVPSIHPSMFCSKSHPSYKYIIARISTDYFKGFTLGLVLNSTRDTTAAVVCWLSHDPFCLLVQDYGPSTFGAEGPALISSPFI